MGEIFAAMTGGPITIDGSIDEPDWKSARAFGDFTAWDSEFNPVPCHSRTSVRTLWDSEYLYIAAELEDEDIRAAKTEHNSKTWEDDVFEIFLKPRRDSFHYYEFHLTPANVTLQLFFPRRGLGSWETFVFDGGMRAAVSAKGTLNDWRDRDEGWTAEIAIPFSAFRETAPPPRAGTEWQAAFCRYDYSYYLPDDRERAKEISSSAKFNSLELGFHQYEAYDRLIFLER